MSNFYDLIEKIQYGDELYDLIEKLYPICRSITGNGVRESLKLVKEKVDIKIVEIPTGTKVFDWNVPKEWNISDAYVKNSKGERVIDFRKHNLHVLNYSVPVHKAMNLEELKEKIHTLSQYPEWIPYLTSYYKEDWGFCLTYNEFQQLENDLYEVCIDSTLKNGNLTYGEYYIKGELDDEIIFTCYSCHPSMCNDNLTGVSIVTYLAKILSNMKLKYSYRFLFIPETIGAITWLALNEEKVKKIKCGMVATCCGDRGALTYKKTRNEGSYLDKVVIKTLVDSDEKYSIVDFFPFGSDERQFSSPGFNLEFGSLTRTMYGNFPEYHTSADDLEFIDKNSLNLTLKRYLEIVYILENDDVYLSLNSKCEPQLGRRGLYTNLGAQKKKEIIHSAIFWMMNYSDGHNSLLDISNRAKIEFKYIRKAADLLIEANLLQQVKE